MNKIIVMILLCLPFIGNAQKQKRNRGGGRDSAIVVAKREFGNMRYAYAIPFYKRYLSYHSDDVESLKDLGYCYKINNQYDSAVYFYERAAQLGGVKDNVLAELYGNMGMYNKAVKAYDSLLRSGDIDTSSNKYKLYKTRQRGFYNHTVYYQDTVDYKLYYLKVNTPMNEFSPAILDSGFVFESNRGHRARRKNEFAWDAKPFSQLYVQPTKQNLRVNALQDNLWSDKKIRRSISDYTLTTVNDNNIFTPRFDFKKYNYKEQIEVPLLDRSFGMRGNYGSISFTKDGKEAYFTKNQKVKKGVSELEIWSAKRTGKDDWSKFKKLNINEKGNSIFHPAISDDGSRLYFAAEQAGGYGGTDIYYAEKLSDGKWGAATNAGERINTAGNELFPTFYEGVLYFSSNGHGGLGGLDVFRYLPNENAIENVGAPINSTKDDLGYSRRGEGGYVSSNRYGSDDIFEYEYAAKRVKVYGKTVKNRVIREGASVKLYNIDKNSITDSTVSDVTGTYQLKGRPNSRYKLMINDGVEPEMVKDIVTGNVDMDLGETEVTPVPMIDRVIEEPEEEVVIKRKEVAEGEAKKYVVYYNLDKSYLSENDKVVLNELVSQLKKKKELNAVIGSFTDCSMDMDYNIQLSNRRSAAVTKYLKEMGVAAGRIIESHYGKSYLVQQCEENKYDVKEQLANRRSEIYVTENKKKSWDALSKEFANPPTVYSKDIENREPMSTPRKDGRGRARDIRGGRNAIGQTDVTLNDNNTPSQSDNESVAAEKSNKGRGQSQSMMDGDTIVFVIYFNMDQYDLGNSFGTLLGLKDLMKTFSDYQCILTGHTDNEGSAAYDQKLSERRANTVKNYFISYGIDPVRLKSIGYGSRKSANKSEVEVAEGWKNRRVEVRLYR